MKYLKRISDELLKRKLKTFGGVLIVGPKGCGKTTSAKRFAKSFIEFQDEDRREGYLEVANTMPSRLLIGDKPSLFDEWQDASKIWGAIRKDLDDTQKKGQYILTGSSSKDIKTPHSGTTRISTLKMYPLSLYESKESNGKVSLSKLFNDKKIDDNVSSSLNFEQLIFAICRGGWPSSLSSFEKDEYRLDIAKDLVYQLINNDISSIMEKKIPAYISESFLKSYSRNLASLASSKTIIEDISSNNDLTKNNFYDCFEALNKLVIIDEVSAWSPSIRSTSAIRSKNKRNFIDPSIAVAALNLSPSYFNEDFKTLGFLFECLCIRDLRVYSSSFNGKISYYHDRYDLEIDAVLTMEDNRYALIEFKLGINQVEKACQHLNEVEMLIKKNNEESKKNVIPLPTLKIVITGFGDAYKRNDDIFVIPITCLKD